MRRAIGWTIAASAVIAAVAVGSWQGQRVGPPANAASIAASEHVAPGAATPAPARKSVSRALPLELEELDGTAFVDAMPELERRARGGDAKATRLLVRRLQGCSDFQRGGEERERERIDAEYAHQLEIQKHLQNPKLVIDETWHAARIQTMLDRRDRCEALSSRDVARRFDWAALALSRHDREVALMLTARGSFVPTSIERVRHTEALIALAAQESVELDRLVESGDTEALAAAAGMWSPPNYSLVEGGNNAAKAYALAYALSLTSDSTRQWRADAVMNQSGAELSPEQIDTARRDGQALYDRCCRSRGGGAAH